MKYRPHDYQRFCIEYIIRNPIAAIFLDCGLGKTSITLAAIESLMHDRFEINKVLVVAPLRVATVSWPDEIRKFDEFSSLTYSLVIGNRNERLKALKNKADIYIINRENLSWLIDDSGVPFDFDTVVLDELSGFKNWNSKRFRSFMKVRPLIKRVIGLTGTPSPNGLMDLFAQIKCLDMGQRLGRFITQYRSVFFRPGRTNGQIVYNYIPLPGAEERIYERISDIAISMKAMDHIRMPELVRVRYPVYMDRDEEELYNDMKRELVLVNLNEQEVTAANAAALSGKLCQMSNGAVYSDEKETVRIHDRKLDALEDLIEASNGKPLLVAYWFQHDLERIIDRLSELGVNYGLISTDDSIRKWNKGEYTVGLIHPASAGHGLNLQQGGNHLVWFGLTWSLELYKQTIARLWRQGQSEKTVIIQHIVTIGTIDEDILDALDSKEKSQEALINAVRANLKEVV